MPRGSVAAIGVFDAKYVGSVPVPELKGKVIVDNAISQAKVMGKGGHGMLRRAAGLVLIASIALGRRHAAFGLQHLKSHAEAVVLTVSSEGVRSIEGLTGV
jgi:hypothetical protein